MLPSNDIIRRFDTQTFRFKIIESNTKKISLVNCNISNDCIDEICEVCIILITFT